VVGIERLVGCASVRAFCQESDFAEVLDQQLHEKEDQLMDFTNLKSVKQIAEMNDAFTEGSLRWLIFNSESNGLERVLVRLGTRVYFDLAALEDWLEEGRASGGAPKPPLGKAS